MDELASIIAHAQQAQQAVQHATRQRDSALAERKNAIKQLAAGGMTLDQISAILGLSRSRIGLIVHDNKTLKPGSRRKKKPRVKRVYTSIGEWDGIL